MIGILRQSWRNFFRNLHRYRVLLLALVIITALLTAVLGSVLGMHRALREKASRYFAGDVIVLGFAGTGKSTIEDPEKVAEAIDLLPERGVELRARSRRSTHYEPENTELFFAGYWTPQRRLVGVEWELERPILANFDFVAGGVPDAGDQEGVLISSATAEELRISVGDALLVSIRSDRGRINTGELLVRGIYEESSFFGFTTYLHRRALNRLREAPEDEVNEMGVYLENPTRQEGVAAETLAAALAQELPSFGVLKTREAYERAARVRRERREYGVVTLGAQLAEINDLLGAITLIAGAVMALFLGITVVGVSNTFTMIVWERTREIGTLRALGMQRARAVALFLAEALFLGLFGVAVGGTLGVGILAGLRNLVEFPPNVVTTLFLTGGRLAWEMPPWGIPAVGMLAVIASLFGALRAAVRAGRLDPVEALRHRN